MTIVELVSYPASEAYLQNHSLLNPAFDMLSKVEGQIESFHGIQIQDGSTAYLAVIWETVEHHKKMMQHDSYPDFLNIYKPSLGGTPEIIHIDTKSDPSMAFEAPVSQIVMLTIKPGRVANDAAALLDALTGLEGPIGATWGCTEEDKSNFVIFMGWPSLEAHDRIVEHEVFVRIFDAVREIGNIVVAHVELRKHVKPLER